MWYRYRPFLVVGIGFVKTFFSPSILTLPLALLSLAGCVSSIQPKEDCDDAIQIRQPGPLFESRVLTRHSDDSGLEQTAFSTPVFLSETDSAIPRFGSVTALGATVPGSATASKLSIVSKTAAEPLLDPDGLAPLIQSDLIQSDLIQSETGEVVPVGHVGEPILSPPILAVQERSQRIVKDAFIETDVRHAIESLADQAQISVVVDDQVRGFVNGIVDSEPFDRALNKILLPLGYYFRDNGSDYYIGTLDADSPIYPYLCERFLYQALHRSPESLLERLPERLKPFVRIDSHGGRVIVEAPNAVAQQVLNEFKELDIAIPQVVLEALVCVYSPQTNFRFGFDFQQGVTLSDANGAGLSVDSLGIGLDYAGAGVGGALNNFQFTTAFLRALEQQGKVEIEAAPRVMAEDGKKAKIHIGRETFFSVQPNVTGVVLRQSIQKVDSGIMLELTPTVRSPYVTVEIERAEVSEDIRSDETQSNSYDQFPIINRRRVGTTVHVCDGETIVIGGLSQNQNIDLLNKVPIIGDVPFLGRLFRRVETRQQEVEVAIFISPQIVDREYAHQ